MKQKQLHISRHRDEEETPLTVAPLIGAPSQKSHSGTVSNLLCYIINIWKVKYVAYTMFSGV